MRDRADSTVIGVLVIVAVAVALATGLYVWVGKADEAGDVPKIVALGAPERDGPGVTTFTLPPAATSVDWNDLALDVEGVEGGYRIQVTGEAFDEAVDDGAWVGATLLDGTHAVRGRDKVTVTLDDPTEQGRLVVLDPGANRIVTAADLRR